MTARREGLVKKEDEHVVAEDDPTQASGEYKKWRSEKIGRYLEHNADNNASDHSTTMTNPKHARLALAYDVAVGVCEIGKEDLHDLRVLADWRMLSDVPRGNPHKRFFDYFDIGLFSGLTPINWVRKGDKESAMPDKITDRREYPARKTEQPGERE